VKVLTTFSVIQSCVGHLQFYAFWQQNNGITKCLEDFGQNLGSDGLVINDIRNNVYDIRFLAIDGTNSLKGTGQIFFI